MKKGWSGSQNKYKDLITNRVVGQMFLPGVVGVDRFKTKFEGVSCLAYQFLDFFKQHSKMMLAVLAM